MFLVVGLGNPGPRYERTRHNIGFFIADAFVRRHSFPDYRDKFAAMTSRHECGGVPVLVIKPMTFMNLSGASVQPAAAFHKIPVDRIFVVHDELDLPFGELRLKVGGGHAGHNGLRSIGERLGTLDFLRLRVGIGRPPPGFRGDVADYVLSDFAGEEAARVPDVVARGEEFVTTVVREGIRGAMNRLHPKAPKKRPPVVPPLDS